MEMTVFYVEDYYADTMGSNKKAVGEYGGANTVKRIYWLVYGR